MSGFYKYHIGVAVLAASLELLSIVASANANVEISAKPTANMSCSGGVCTPTARKAVLNVSDLASMLASGDITVSSGNQAQDIVIDDALRWISTSRLTLDSYHAIAFNSPVVVAGTGALTIKTDDGGSGGDFSFFGKGHVEFRDTVSSLIINGHGYPLVATMKQLKTAAHLLTPYFALANSLHLAKHNYRSAPIPSLDATFEGLGNTIFSLTINDSTPKDLVGLFGFLGGTSGHDSIRDIKLVSVNIHANGQEQQIGALVGQNVFGEVANSHVTGEVSASGLNSVVGGLVGDNQNATVAHSGSSVAVSAGTGVFAVGGLVGDNIGACEGSCFGLVDQSYSTGGVSSGDNTMTGGLAGRNLGGGISNSYATGTVEGGSDGFIGGLLGDNEVGDSSPTITSSYSTGAVVGGSGATIGGLIGQDLAQTGTTNAYWDLDTSGIGDPSKGAGNVANDAGITGLTTGQFTSGLPASFDKKVWKEKSSINNGYPYLIGNPPG